MKSQSLFLICTVWLELPEKTFFPLLVPLLSSVVSRLPLTEGQIRSPVFSCPFSPPAPGNAVSLCQSWCHHGSWSFIPWPYFSHSWFDRLPVRIAVRKRGLPPPARCQVVVFRALLQKGTCWICSPHSHVQGLCESCGQGKWKRGSCACFLLLAWWPGGGAVLVCRNTGRHLETARDLSPWRGFFLPTRGSICASLLLL